MKKLLLLLCILLSSFAIFASDVAVMFDREEITEGESVNAMIVRGDTDGALTVNYTVGAPKLDISQIVASSRNNQTLAALIDGDRFTSWMNGGNAKHDSKDDEPWLELQFHEPSIIDGLRIVNYVNPGHEFRGIKDVLVQSTVDGVTYKDIAEFKFNGARSNDPAYQYFKFPSEKVKNPVIAVRLLIYTNQSKTFYQGTSYEGDNANGSYVGLAEIEILGRGIESSTLNHDQSSVIIPDGQDRVSFPIHTVNDAFIYGDRVMEIKIMPSKAYTLDPAYKSYVVVRDNDFGPKVSITTTKTTSDFSSGEVGEFTFKRDSAVGELTIRYTTSNTLLPFQYVGASSVMYNSSLANLYDNNLYTNWMNSGNAVRESEEDDEPWVSFTFDQIYPIGMMKVTNLIHRGHNFRSTKQMEVLYAEDEYNFQSLGFIELPASDDRIGPVTIDIPLGGLNARRIGFKIFSNYSKEFYKGTSFEGEVPNGSITGLAEVQFFTGSTVKFEDIEESIDNYIVFPQGQDTVTLKITPKKVVGDKFITVTVLEDLTAYTLDYEKSESTVRIK